LNNQALVNTMQAAGSLADERVAAAFRAVPRHLFLPGVPLEDVYSDKAIYNRTDDAGGFVGGSDEPTQIAFLLTVADLQPGQNVLIIGAGTGYSAGLAQHMVGADGLVTAMEIDRSVADAAQKHLRTNKQGVVNIVPGDGAAGYAPRASYDRIISSVAIWDIPPAWKQQLRPGGRIVTPLLLDGLQIMAAFQRTDNDEWHAGPVRSCSFVPIQGSARPPMQHLYMGGGSALRLYSNEVRGLDSARLHLLMSADAEHCHLGAAPTARQYWDGFVPYLMMNVPDGYEFVCYTVEGDKMVYGLSGRGFALISNTSATFVGANDNGDTHCFAGVDAFLEIDQSYTRWAALGSPSIDQLRVRLIPQPTDTAQGRLFNEGYVYRRPHHQLHVFLA
jgi:protein-L-isoaspartate(D-aspartate) O-methyltransferase